MNEPLKSLTGKALVAAPALADPNFFRTVVYIIHHDAEGAVGVVINRPTEKTVGDVLSDIASVCSGNQAPIYWGGPVGGPLTVLFQGDDDGGSVRVDSSPEKILELCADEAAAQSSDESTTEPLEQAPGDGAQPNGANKSDSSEANYKLFDGYSGWGAGQLDGEMHQGGWLVWDISPQDVFSPVDEVWERAVREIGRDILSVGIGAAKMPDDPACN